MEWIIIIGVFIAIMLYFLHKKKEINSDTTMNKGILEEQSVPAAMDFTKKDDSLSFSTFKQNFTTKIRGVSYKNPDGTDRQKIIKKCKEGEGVQLVREPDNPHDAACIAVFRMTGEQIGYIGKDVAFRHPALKDLTYYMDIGAKVSAKILRIMGEEHQNYGCVIEIAVGDIPCEEKEFEAKELIAEARRLEDSDPQKAIKFYVKAIKDLQEADQLYQDTLFYKRTGEELDYNGPNSVFRKTRFPINRLSLVLEKHKKYKESLSIVERYEKMTDKRGLTKGDIESIRKRKDRMIKKLS